MSWPRTARRGLRTQQDIRSDLRDIAVCLSRARPLPRIYQRASFLCASCSLKRVSALPQAAAPSHRCITSPNLAHKVVLLILCISSGAPSLYLPASRTDAGDTQVQILLEVQAINAAGDRQRSWFVGDDTVVGGECCSLALPTSILPGAPARAQVRPPDLLVLLHVQMARCCSLRFSTLSFSWCGSCSSSAAKRWIARASLSVPRRQWQSRSS